MRVLHVTPSMNPKAGGVCQAVQSMVRGLAKAQVHSEIVCLDAEQTLQLHTGCPVYRLGPWKSPWLYSAKLLPWLEGNLFRFDRIVVHGLWQYHAYAAHKAWRLLQKRNGKGAVPKLFVMPHGMLDPYFQRAASRKLKAIRNEIYWRLIEQAIINKADSLFFTCERERLLAAEPFSSYAPKMERVVGLGVEEPPAYKTCMQQAFLKRCPQVNAKPYLLFLSRIDEKKGVELLIEAYANVYQQSKALHLVVAGPGIDTAYGKQLKELTASLGLDAVVHFPGMLTGEAKWGAFYGCEAFVLPSHQENFGIAVVEALACGRAVLISNQVNICTEIQNAKAGLIAKDTLQGAQALLGQWQNLSAEERDFMHQNARKCFEQFFAVSAVSAHLLKAIKE